MSEQPLSVTALTRYIKYKFDKDEHLKDVLIKGEISNFKHNVRGHFYFTLKDEKASIKAVMFRSDASGVIFKPKDGMTVLLRGYVSVFEVAGSYQIYVKSMDEVGLGNLYQQYLQLKATLEKEGYFDDAHKQPIPTLPRQIGVLTSATGAAVRDIINIINRRFPMSKIVVYPTTVQGVNAKDEIAKNIARADKDPNDVLIVGRGGGSIEDLWAFNERIVAQAIYDASTPIIASIGHETDFTISDFVADKRAPTPSGAAEIAVPDQMTFKRDIESAKNRLYDALRRIVRFKRERLVSQKDRYVFKDPQRLIEKPATQLESLQHRLTQSSPASRLKDNTKNLETLNTALNKAYERLIVSKTQALNDKTNRLKVQDPRLIVKQGYTLAKKAGNIVKSVQDISVGDTLEMEFQDGAITVDVKEIKEENHE